MDLSKILQVKWCILKRSKGFYVFIIFNYLILALVDSKSFIWMSDIDEYIYRYLFQQLWIVFSIPLLVQIVFNEHTINSIGNYMHFYYGASIGAVSRTKQAEYRILHHRRLRLAGHL